MSASQFFADLKVGIKETQGVCVSCTGDTIIILIQSLGRDVSGCIRTKNSLSCVEIGLSAASSSHRTPLSSLGSTTKPPCPLAALPQ